MPMNLGISIEGSFLCVCVCGPEVSINYLPLLLFIFLSLRQGLLMNRDLTFSVPLVGSQAPQMLLFLPACPGAPNIHCSTWVSHSCKGSKHWSSCLHMLVQQSLTHWATSTALVFRFVTEKCGGLGQIYNIIYRKFPGVIKLQVQIWLNGLSQKEKSAASLLSHEFFFMNTVPQSVIGPHIAVCLHSSCCFNSNAENMPTGSLVATSRSYALLWTQRVRSLMSWQCCSACLWPWIWASEHLLQSEWATGSMHV